MLNRILNITGMLALYGAASMFLATLLLGTYLMYAWNIDKTKRIRLLALAQGLEITDIQKAVEDAIAKMSYDQILEERAKRLRQEEAQGMSSDQSVSDLLSTDAQKIDAELKKIRAERESFDKYVKDKLDQARTAGIAEETRILEEAKPEYARDVILSLIRDNGATQRVLTMLMAMDEANRSKILYAMGAEPERKELVDLLQRIGNGEPLISVLEEANQNKNPSPRN